MQAPDPMREKMLEARIAKHDARIKFILRNPGETEADQVESEAELRRLRKERENDVNALELHRAAALKVVVIPTEEEIVDMIDHLGTVLTQATIDCTPELAGLIRQLIDKLTGGRIDLEQAGERRARRGWLRGRFPLRIVQAIAWRLTGIEIAEESACREVVVDYRKARRHVSEGVISQVLSLYDEGTLELEIVRQLCVARSTVTRILDDRDAALGTDRPDGRTRRSNLLVKHQEPPLYQQLAERVKSFADDGYLFQDIADKLTVNRDTVTSIWKFWHTSRNLAVPDGRTRRKSLERKST
jgi:hypothetical protein